MITATTKLLGLLGDPVEHSLSPVIQNAFAEATGQDFCYLAFSVTKKEPEDLSLLLEGAHRLGVRGFNVTVPLKTKILSLLPTVDPFAARIGAVNTLSWVGEVGGTSGYRGYNTDAQGLLDDLKVYGVSLQGKETVILGAGGAARAAAFGAAQAGANLTIVNRTPEKGELLAEEVRTVHPERKVRSLPLEKATDIPAGAVAIQCTSAGFTDGSGESPVKEMAFFEKLSFAYDVVYHPAKTQFLSLAEQAGKKGTNGLGMLVRQAAASFAVWTGTQVPEEVCRQVMEKIRTGLSESTS